MIKQICLLACILLLPNFSIQAQTVTTEYDFSKDEPKAKEIMLSEIASSVDYIPLQTPPGVFISHAYRLLDVDDHLILLDAGKMKYVKLFIFNSDGSYKALIHSVGKGPGEYVSVSDFTYKPNSKTILIVDENQKKVLEYTLDGTFVKETILEFGPKVITWISPGYLVFAKYLRYTKADENGQFQTLIITDENFKRVKSFPSEVEYQGGANSPWISTPTIYNVQGLLRYRQPEVNKLFSIDDNLNLYARYVINFGKYTPPANIKATLEKYRKERHLYKEWGGLWEFPQHDLVMYQYYRESILLYIDRQTNEVRRLKSSGRRPGFINDFDGFIPFAPRSELMGNKIYAFHDAIDLIEQCEKRKVKSFKSKFPEQHKKLLNILDNITEESNPVLQLVTLK